MLPIEIVELIFLYLPLEDLKTQNLSPYFWEMYVKHHFPEDYDHLIKFREEVGVSFREAAQKLTRGLIPVIEKDRFVSLTWRELGSITVEGEHLLILNHKKEVIGCSNTSLHGAIELARKTSPLWGTLVTAQAKGSMLLVPNLRDIAYILKVPIQKYHLNIINQTPGPFIVKYLDSLKGTCACNLCKSPAKYLLMSMACFVRDLRKHHEDIGLIINPDIWTKNLDEILFIE